MPFRPTRRAALGALAAAAVLPAHAAAPLVGRQAPGFQRIKVGRFEVTALLDGTLPLELEMFQGLGTDGPALLARAFRPNGPVLAHTNAYAVNTGERLYLIDAGTVQGFAPTLAHLPDALAAAGIQPAQVDALIMTHLHPDHVGGAVRDNAALFPNAEMIVPEAEAAFWLDPGLASRMPADFQPFVQIAQGGVAAYGNRVRRLAPGALPAIGFEQVALPGHTPGHTGYIVSDSGQSLLVWGDIVHAPPLQFARPAATIAFDSDQAQAAQTRSRIMDRVASDRMMVAGMHMPFPGFGHVAKDGEGYAFIPIPFAPL